MKIENRQAAKPVKPEKPVKPVAKPVKPVKEEKPTKPSKPDKPTKSSQGNVARATAESVESERKPKPVRSVKEHEKVIRQERDHDDENEQKNEQKVPTEARTILEEAMPMREEESASTTLVSTATDAETRAEAKEGGCPSAVEDESSLCSSSKSSLTQTGDKSPIQRALATPNIARTMNRTLTQLERESSPQINIVRGPERDVSPVGLGRQTRSRSPLRGPQLTDTSSSPPGHQNQPSKYGFEAHLTIGQDPYEVGFAESDDILQKQAQESSYLDCVATLKYDKVLQESNGNMDLAQEEPQGRVLEAHPEAFDNRPVSITNSADLERNRVEITKTERDLLSRPLTEEELLETQRVRHRQTAMEIIGKIIEANLHDLKVGSTFDPLHNPLPVLSPYAAKTGTIIDGWLEKRSKKNTLVYGESVITSCRSRLCTFAS